MTQSALNGLIFDIRKFSVHDGPGIRTTVFFKGCPLDCWWCHNPESQSPMPEVMLWDRRCVRCGQCIPECPIEAIQLHDTAPSATDREICTVCGSCIDACAADARQLVGRRTSVEEVMAEILSDRSFYEDSKGGVTFSGGEPFIQRAFLMALLRACRAERLHTVVDTSGFAPWNAFVEASPLVDLFLYDLKLIDDARHRTYTGVSNQVILANLRALVRSGACVILRCPVIPGINDDDENMNALLELAASLRIEQVDLLPYHAAAAGKYERLARPYRMADDLPALSEAELHSLAEPFRRRGIPVVVGG